jgi:hypothetical protein
MEMDRSTGPIDAALLVSIADVIIENRRDTQAPIIIREFFAEPFHPIPPTVWRAGPGGPCYRQGPFATKDQLFLLGIDRDHRLSSGLKRWGSVPRDCCSMLDPIKGQTRRAAHSAVRGFWIHCDGQPGLPWREVAA